MAVGTVVGARSAHDVACLEDARKGFGRDDNGGVCLVILEQDVVARLVALDEVVLEQEGVLLRAHYDILDVGDVLHEHRRLRRLVGVVEIGRHPPLQILRLADIDHPPSIVQILVAPWRLRQVVDYFFNCHRLTRIKDTD